MTYKKMNCACSIFGTTLSYAAGNLDFSTLEHRTDDAKAPVVYFTKDITPEGVIAAYKALGRTPTGKVAVKLSTGEKGNPHYLDPQLIKDLVQMFDSTIVECNTAYGGARRYTADHRKLAEDHGFTGIAPVDIMDAEGEMNIPVEGGTHLKYDIVGTHLADYDFMMVLTHFKGHPMGGFGGAMKNISIGVASSNGKANIHTGGEVSDADGWLKDKYMANPSKEHNNFIESMAEAAKAVSDFEGKGEKMLYISVMNHMSVDCDCVSNPAKPDMHDIGILASLDPVALDQACIDLVYAAPDSHSLRERIETRNGTLILSHAEKIGLGQRHYQFKVIE